MESNENDYIIDNCNELSSIAKDNNGTVEESLVDNLNSNDVESPIVDDLDKNGEDDSDRNLTTDVEMLNSDQHPNTNNIFNTNEVNTVTEELESRHHREYDVKVPLQENEATTINKEHETKDQEHILSVSNSNNFDFEGEHDKVSSLNKLVFFKEIGFNAIYMHYYLKD